MSNPMLSTVIWVLCGLLVAMVLFAPFAIPAAWRLLRLSGRHPAWSLLLLVPYVGIVVVLALLRSPRCVVDEPLTQAQPKGAT